MSAVRGRYAPSPTGEIHLGNASTALLAWLSIRARGGTFVMRMEDLDQGRVRPGYAEAILPVTPGESLIVVAGGPGQNGRNNADAPGGEPGGGDGVIVY